MKKTGVASGFAALDPITICGKSRSPLPTEPGTYKPDYVIKHYSGGVYSVCRFKRASGLGLCFPREEMKTSDKKLDNAFSRAKSMVKQYGLCNPWKYFMTLTLDKEKYDRYDLELFRKDLQQFIRDCRKRYKRLYPEGYTDRLSVLIVPETHKDGAWHMHGLLNGIPAEATALFELGKHPAKLVHGGFLNWPDYASKFGFVSLGLIRDQYATVMYTVKYISKSVEALADMKGQHLYFHSRPLMSAETISEVYGYDTELDNCLTWHGPFCSTGMVVNHDWIFPLRDGCEYERYEFLNDDEISFIDNYGFDPETIDPFQFGIEGYF